MRFTKLSEFSKASMLRCVASNFKIGGRGGAVHETRERREKSFRVIRVIRVFRGQKLSFQNLQQILAILTFHERLGERAKLVGSDVVHAICDFF